MWAIRTGPRTVHCARRARVPAAAAAKGGAAAEAIAPTSERLPYHERQSRADSCRVHAVNAAAGRAAVTYAGFQEHCARFEEAYGLPRSRAPHPDHFCADANSPVGYVLHRETDLFTVTLGLGNVLPLLRLLGVDRLSAASAARGLVLPFSDAHVWTLKRGPGHQWHEIDSLQGRPSPVSTARVDGFATPSHGAVVALDAADALACARALRGAVGAFLGGEHARSLDAARAFLHNAVVVPGLAVGDVWGLHEVAVCLYHRLVGFGLRGQRDSPPPVMTYLREPPGPSRTEAFTALLADFL